MYKVVVFNANNSSVVFLTIDLSLEIHSIRSPWQIVCCR